MKSSVLGACFLGCLLASSIAYADEVEVTQPAEAPATEAKVEKQEPAAQPPPEEKEKEDRRAYISISPLHLIAPIVELTGEVRVDRHVGIAGIAGVGSLRTSKSAPRFTVWEVGAQFLGYPVGHFDHGMQLGVEAVYVGLAGSTGSGSAQVTGLGHGFAVGPLLGYKFASDVGFSLNIQGGVQYLVARAEATAKDGTSASASDSAWIPLLNLNLGWSF